MALIALVEAIGHAIYEPPADLDVRDRESMQGSVSGLPVGALLFVLAAWLVGTFFGGWVAAYVAKERPLVYAAIIGGFVLVGVAMNLTMIPHPVWFAVVGVAGVLLMVLLTAKLAPLPRGQT